MVAVASLGVGEATFGGSTGSSHGSPQRALASGDSGIGLGDSSSLGSGGCSWAETRSRWRGAAERRRQDAADGKRRRRSGLSSRTARSYEKLLEEARREVPSDTAKQIQVDIPRTFGALPEEFLPKDASRPAMEEVLENVLLTAEWLNGDAARADIGATYTQGMNFLAAMCLVDLWEEDEKEHEELAFWLFDLLLVDVLGTRFFAEWPPLLGYHASAFTLRSLVPLACPGLAAALGDEFEDLVAMLSCRYLVPCFVGLLPVALLLALWDELIQAGEAKESFPRRPLICWFLALLRTLEPGIAAAVAVLMPGEPKAPMAFQTALRMASVLPAAWRPSHAGFGLCPPGAELERATSRAEDRFVSEAEERKLLQLGIVPADRIAALHREFALLPQKPAGRGISVQTLRSVLQRAGVVASSARDSVEGLFRLLDRDGSGCLDFLELMTGLLVLSAGRREQKMRLIFELYDTDNSGQLGTDELLCLAQALVKMSATTSLSRRSLTLSVDSDLAVASEASHNFEEIETATRFRNRLMILDTDSDGCISWDEFRTGIHSEPLLVQALTSVGMGVWEDTRPRMMPRHILPRRVMLWAACCGASGFDSPSVYNSRSNML